MARGGIRFAASSAFARSLELVAVVALASSRSLFAWYCSADLSLGSAAGIVSEAAEGHAILVVDHIVQESLGALKSQTLHGLASLASVLENEGSNEKNKAKKTT